MRALLAIATLLLACSAAQAQYTIEYDGRTIRIDPDRGTVSIPGVYDNTGKKAKRPRTDQDGSQKAAPSQQQTTVDRQPAPSQVVKPPAQAHVPAPVNAAPSAPNATTNTAPADSAALPLLPPLPPPPAPAPIRQPVAPVDVPAAAAAIPSIPAPVLSPAPAARPQGPAPTVSTAPVLSPSPAPRPQVPSATVATIAPAQAVPDPNSPVGIWLTE